MEAYLTMTDLVDIRAIMMTLNQNYKTSRYGLEVRVTDKSANKPIGIIKQTNKSSEFVFVPDTGYTPYQPTDRGE